MTLPPPIATMLKAAAAQHGVPAELALAVAWVESRGNTTATSSKGAKGVMQLMPDTARAYGVADPYDAASNIDAGVRMLAKLIKTTGGIDRALASYNWGPGNVRRATTWPASVRSYVAKVRARMGHTPKPTRPHKLVLQRKRPSGDPSGRGVAIAFIVLGMLASAGVVLAARKYAALQRPGGSI